MWEAGEPETALAWVRRVPDIAILDAGLLNTSEDNLTAARVAFVRDHRLVLITSDRPTSPMPLVEATTSSALEKSLELEALARLVADAPVLSTPDYSDRCGRSMRQDRQRASGSRGSGCRGRGKGESDSERLIGASLTRLDGWIVTQHVFMTQETKRDQFAIVAVDANLPYDSRSAASTGPCSPSCESPGTALTAGSTRRCRRLPAT